MTRDVSLCGMLTRVSWIARRLFVVGFAGERGIADGCASRESLLKIGVGTFFQRGEYQTR